MAPGIGAPLPCSTGHARDATTRRRPDLHLALHFDLADLGGGRGGVVGVAGADQDVVGLRGGELAHQRVHAREADVRRHGDSQAAHRRQHAHADGQRHREGADALDLEAAIVAGFGTAWAVRVGDEHAVVALAVDRQAPVPLHHGVNVEVLHDAQRGLEAQREVDEVRAVDLEGEALGGGQEVAALVLDGQRVRQAGVALALGGLDQLARVVHPVARVEPHDEGDRALEAAQVGREVGADA
jgi:hypothetical protein